MVLISVANLVYISHFLCVKLPSVSAGLLVRNHASSHPPTHWSPICKLFFWHLLSLIRQYHQCLLSAPNAKLRPFLMLEMVCFSLEFCFS